MPKYKTKEDQEWVPGPSKRPKKSKNTNQCIIHCTDSTDELVKLPSAESWNKLLEAALIRKDERVTKLAETLNEGEKPDIEYHMKCRKSYTHKGSLELIQNKSKVNLKYGQIFQCKM